MTRVLHGVLDELDALEQGTGRPVLNHGSGQQVVNWYRPALKEALATTGFDAIVTTVSSEVGDLLYPSFDRFMLPAVKSTGTWEFEEAEFVRSHLRPGGHALNIGANVVSPANDFSNLWPRRISFRTGGVITCFMGIALMPWKLLADYNTFILGWLGGYAAVLGPVAGIMICDYFVVRRRVLQVDDLYLRGGIYEYSSGFNWRAVLALALGAGTALVGLEVPSMRFLYDYSWFVGFAVSFAVYYAMMKFHRPAVLSPMAAS